MSIIYKTGVVLRRLSGYMFSVLLAPQHCICCGSETLYFPLCALCRLALSGGIEAKDNRCTRCGRPLISEKNICIECRTIDTIAHVDSVFPLFPYVLWKKELLFVWKTEGCRSLSPFFAHLIYKVLKQYFPRIPVIPVPPRPGKIFREGWDQIDELARFLHGLYGVRIFRPLVRLSARQQKKLNRTERLSCTEKKYALKKTQRCTASIPEEAVLLDDIITTGATLEICARLLKEAGVQRVYAITLFSC